MKTLFFFLLFPIGAKAYHCPSYINDNQNAQRAQEWLQKFRGINELHGCEVEIEVCEKGDLVNETAPIGEVLLKTSDGRESYLSIDFPDVESPHLDTQVVVSTTAFHFTKKDRFYEKINGRTEVWRFEMRTRWKEPETLNVLELGVYTTNSQLNQDNGNDSQWFICSP